jgi:hypothetical protein
MVTCGRWRSILAWHRWVEQSTTGLMTQMARTRFHILTDTEIAALKQYLDSR